MQALKKVQIKHKVAVSLGRTKEGDLHSGACWSHIVVKAQPRQPDSRSRNYLLALLGKKKQCR